MKKICSSVCVSRTSCLLQILLVPLQQISSIKTAAQLRQKVPPAQLLVSKSGQQQMRYTRVRAQGKHTVVFMQNTPPRLFLGNSSGRGHVFYLKSFGRVFLPPPHKKTGIPQSHLLPQFQQSTVLLLKQIPDADITKYDQNKTSGSDPVWLKLVPQHPELLLECSLFC